MTKNSTVVMDCEFFPCWEWFNTFQKAENVLIEQYEYFQKISYRNRAYVAGPNGLICLSVPLAGGRNQRVIMKDAKISQDENWQALHWKTLQACYRRSPYFEYFEEAIKSFYEQKFDFLMDANLASLKLITDLLQIKKEFQLTPKYVGEVENDFRTAFLPKHRKQTNQPEYIQVFSDRNGFEPNLSMLDYLFCCGRWE